MRRDDELEPRRSSPRLAALLRTLFAARAHAPLCSTEPACSTQSHPPGSAVPPPLPSLCPPRSARLWRSARPPYGRRRAIEFRGARSGRPSAALSGPSSDRAPVRRRPSCSSAERPPLPVRRSLPRPAQRSRPTRQAVWTPLTSSEPAMVVRRPLSASSRRVALPPRRAAVSRPPVLFRVGRWTGAAKKRRAPSARKLPAESPALIPQPPRSSSRRRASPVSSPADGSARSKAGSCSSRSFSQVYVPVSFSFSGPAAREPVADEPLERVDPPPPPPPPRRLTLLPPTSCARSSFRRSRTSSRTSSYTKYVQPAACSSRSPRTDLAPSRDRSSRALSAAGSPTSRSSSTAACSTSPSASQDCSAPSSRFRSCFGRQSGSSRPHLPFSEPG